MKLWSGLFDQSKVKCPRCLGKGQVDMDDIRRLGKEFKWLPGSCAYCNSKGQVAAKLIDSVPVDTTYLTCDLPSMERDKLINGDRDALVRAASYDAGVESFIQQIRYLHFHANMDALSILEFYQLSIAEIREAGKERDEFLEYVQRVIGR